MSLNTIEDAIKAAKSRVFRRAFVKRRMISTGLFESGWTEISVDVMKWGNIRVSSDEALYGKLTLDGMRLQMENSQGRYNSETDPNSLWYGYANIQRSLLKIEAGFIDSTLPTSGVWSNAEFPGNAVWDNPASLYDYEVWDSENTIFVGVIAGEMTVSDENVVTLNVKPLTQVFKDYAAINLTGYNSSLTASGFMTMVRDQVDVNGQYIFRPFFQDTTTQWDISATTVMYPEIEDDISKSRDYTVWDVMEKIAEAENYMVYVDSQGVFKFSAKDPSATPVFHFHGSGSFDSTYGHTIKKITKFGKNFNNYYSRVRIQFREEGTETSYLVKEGTFQISGSNPIWNLGLRTFEINNFWFQDTAAAQNVLNTVYDELSNLQDKIEFSTSFIPHLSLLDRVQISYDSTTKAKSEELWDANDWDTELTWDDSKGNAIILEGAEFKFLSMDINLDSFECKYIGREV